MRSFGEHAMLLSELFGQPHRFLKKSQQSGGVSYQYSMGSSGSADLDVRFFPTLSDGDWDVNFYRGGSTALTGEGDAPRVFASVLDAVKRFIKEHSPETLAFGASKSELDQKTLSYRSGSRVKLYRKMVMRFAPTMGYVLDPELGKRYGGSTSEVFVLSRRKP
jgi:hypothetical protein